MDNEALRRLAEEYPEVRELLRDNYSLSVAVMAARMESWQQKMELRLDAFDENHTTSQAKLSDRVAKLEQRLDSVREFSKQIQNRLKALEGEQ